MSRRNYWRLALLGCIASLAVGCRRPESPDPIAQDREAWRAFDSKTVEHNAKAARLAARAQNAFGLKLLRIAVAKQPTQNTFFSPTSLWMTLAMAENGAGGATQTELQHLLSFPSSNSAASIAALRAVIKAQGVKINLASAIWADQKTPFSPSFEESSAQLFGATAQNLDFTSPAAVGTINDWVKEQTDGEIDDLVQQLPGTGAVLTNALYFRGRWVTPFKTENTRDAPFHLPGGSEKTVPLMQDEFFESVKGDNFRGAILPYNYSSCEMWALLPAKGKTPLDVLAHLDTPNWKNISRKNIIRK